MTALTPAAAKRLRASGLGELVDDINAGLLPAPKVLPHRVSASGTSFISGLLGAARSEYWTGEINTESERLGDGHYFMIEGAQRVPATRAAWQAAVIEAGVGDTAKKLARRIYMRELMRKRRAGAREGST